MRALIFMVLFISMLFSCTGDCASCHTNLDYKNDERHKAMIECKNCHTEEKMGAIDMGSSCGRDCFACHSPSKLQNPALSKEHGMIPQCIQCHQELGKTPFDPKNLFDQKSIFEQIPDFLKK